MRCGRRSRRAPGCSSSRRRTTRPGSLVPRDDLIAFVRGLPRARPAGDRRGVLRLSRAREPPRHDRGSRSRRATTCSRCGRSRSSTASPGLRVGYGVGPAAVVAAMRKVQRGYDVGSARAGGGAREPRRRGRGRAAARREPGGGRRSRRRCSRRVASSRSPEASTNFVLVDVGVDRRRRCGGAPRARRRGAVGRAVRRADALCGSAPAPPPTWRASTLRSGDRSELEPALTPCKPPGSSPEPPLSWLRGRVGARFRMRTTLKRGVGRGHSGNGNGKMQLPPGPIGPVTIYRQPEPPPRSRRSLALRILGWAAVVIVVCVTGVAGGAYLYLHESVAAVAPKSVDVKVTAKRLDLPDRRPAGDRARDRLRPPRRRGQGNARRARTR